MPKAAIERGYAMRVVALDVMAAALQAICGRADTGRKNGPEMTPSTKTMRAGN